MPLAFDFFRNPVYPCDFKKGYGRKGSFIVSVELNSSEKMISRSKDTVATCNLSDIFLEYDAVLDESYATAIGEM